MSPQTELSVPLNTEQLVLETRLSRQWITPALMTKPTVVKDIKNTYTHKNKN